LGTIGHFTFGRLTCSRLPFALSVACLRGRRRDLIAREFLFFASQNSHWSFACCLEAEHGLRGGLSIGSARKLVGRDIRGVDCRQRSLDESDVITAIVFGDVRRIRDKAASKAVVGAEPV
jgi:hypothetical protein